MNEDAAGRGGGRKMRINVNAASHRRRSKIRRNADAANRGGTRKMRISKKNSNNGKRDKRDGEQDGRGLSGSKVYCWAGSRSSLTLQRATQ